MKPARILILVVALVAAGLAGLLAMSLSSKAPVVVETAPVPDTTPTVHVLVATASLPVGERLSPQTTRWMAWPKSNVVAGFITDDTRPQAQQELSGSLVRLPMFDGEPIRLEKLADPSTRTMSALLPAGKRAVATEISVSTGAGGFILPNDRVDVVMVRKGDSDNHVTEVVLSNVRVLAIDQQIEDKGDGQKSVVGATATLELDTDQVRVLATAQQMAERLSLALRSVADAQEQDAGGAVHLLGSGGSGGTEVQVIKSGQIVKSAGANKQ